MFIEIRFYMAVYQLVAWTENGRVKMIPSEVNAFMLDDLAGIERLVDRVRYGTDHEIGDILRVSRACERLGIRLLGVGRMEDAFLLFAQAAECCCSSDGNWVDTDYGGMLCKPLRGRFFTMFCLCKGLVRRYPRLKLAWEASGLQEKCDLINAPVRLWDAENDG